MGAPAPVSNGAVVALAIVAAGLVVYPRPVAEYVNGQQHVKTGATAEASSVWTLINLLRFVHITGFATTFGASLWVGFIGGIIMFKHLPRHQFGNLQGHLFPAFFRLSSATTATNVAILSTLHPCASSTPWQKLQVGVLGLSLIFSLTNLFVIEPITTKLMRERHRAEKEEGISTEPGVVRKQEIEKAGPKLKAINKKFGAAHGISSLINLFGFWCLVVHAVYLASKLSL